MSSANPIIQKQTKYRTPNTRLSPTPGRVGSLHLGHIWLALLNREIAKAAGGMFLVRFEDVLAGEMDAVISDDVITAKCEVMLEELESLDLYPDEVIWQSEEEPVFRHLSLPGIDPEAPKIRKTRFTVFSDTGPITASVREGNSTPYRVFSDALHHCDPIIRGRDLLPEDWLYDDICQRMGIDPPQRVYVPKLSFSEGVMSKSAGTACVDRLLGSGFSKNELIDAVRRSALKDPDGPVEVENIDPHPAPVMLREE